MSEVDPSFLQLPLGPLADAALEAMAGTKGVGYGDIRIHQDRVQGIHVREHDLISLSESQPQGLGVTARGTCGVGFERVSSADRLVPPAAPGTIALS